MGHFWSVVKVVWMRKLKFKSYMVSNGRAITCTFLVYPLYADASNCKSFWHLLPIYVLSNQQLIAFMTTFYYLFFRCNLGFAIYAMLSHKVLKGFFEPAACSDNNLILCIFRLCFQTFFRNVRVLFEQLYIWLSKLFGKEMDVAEILKLSQQEPLDFISGRKVAQGITLILKPQIV